MPTASVATPLLLMLVWPSALANTPRDALEALYASAGGASWRVRGRWLRSGKSHCAWHGVACSAAGDVTSIDIGGNGAVGTLPTQLGALTALRVLNIDESRLSGTLPSELSALSQLETILLASNPALSGTLPDWRRLGALAELDISRTNVSGTIGTTIGSLRALRRLQLDHTRLSGVLPTQIGALGATLESAFAHESRALSGTLPTELGALTALLHGASFAKTRLSGTLPPALGRASRLRALWLDHTALSGTLPAAWGTGLAGLRELELHANRLSGSLAALGPAARRLQRCVLTAAQGHHEPHHSMRPRDREGEPDSNAFDCPLAAEELEAMLGPRCAAHLRCHPRGASRAFRGRGRRRWGRGGERTR